MNGHRVYDWLVDETEAKGTGHERLWTPWRMPYIGGAKEEGCVFCNQLRADDDVASLILHRGLATFVIMNLFPYNTGHIMLVPNAHVATPEDAEQPVVQELAALRRPVLRALRRALACDGFNLGLNVGAVAGAGVAAHMHEHVVPRWTGDANFMPILASTMVLPELLPATYGKLRVEIERELDPHLDGADLVIIDLEEKRVLVEEATGSFPRQRFVDDEPLWRSAVATATILGLSASVVGWAGAQRSGSRAGAALVLSSDSTAGQPVGARWRRLSPGLDLAVAQRAVSRLVPSSASR